MAICKISDLPTTDVVCGDEFFPIVQNKCTKRLNLSAFKTGLGNGNENFSETAEILGGSNNSITLDVGSYSTILGGTGNTLSGSSLSADSPSFIAGNNILNERPGSFIVEDFFTVGDRIVVNCCNNNIAENSINSSIIAGINNQINNSDNSTILGGCNNTIDNSSCSSIIAGSNNSLDADNSFILGSNINGTQNDTTYVNNLSSTDTIYASNIVASSATYEIINITQYELSGFDILDGDIALNGQLSATDIYTTLLLADEIISPSLSADTIEITDVNAGNGFIGSLSAEEIYLDNLRLSAYNDKIYYNDSQGIEEIGLADRADNVYYVSKNGSDNNNGTTIADAFATIEHALSSVNEGDTIHVKTGDYTINNPVTIRTNISLIGDSLRNTVIRPANTTSDMFYVENGIYVNGFAFKDHQGGAAAFAYNPDGSAGVIFQSPYIQNCTSLTSDGVGMRIDGNHVQGLRSMVSDSFTQFNSNGIGVHLLNRGYAQLVSIFTICCKIGILAENGGFCSITNSNCSFGLSGLVADGVSNTLYSGTLSGTYLIGDSTVRIQSSTKPKYLDAIKFESDPIYYTVDGIEDVDTDIYDIRLLGALETALSGSPPDNITFHQRSLITASSITFEYVGAGTDISNATPERGGIPIQANEVVQDDITFAGQVYYTSTDQKGDFRIGQNLNVAREEGLIEGLAFERGLLSILTPYILALESGK